MDCTALITKEAILKLKCDSCQNYLSHFPIYLSGNKQNICGRCSNQLVVGHYAQNVMYEAIGQFIKFPCRYSKEGCTTTFVPKDMPAHECRCEFRSAKCPTRQSTECDWEGPRPNIIIHCHNKHAEMIMKQGEFEVDLSKSCQGEKLLEFESCLFIVKQKYYSINKLLELVILKPEGELNLKQILFKINFETPNRSLVIRDCLNESEKGKNVEIFLDSLKSSESFSSNTKAKIILEKPSKKQIVKIDETLSEDLLTDLKCFFCHEYSLPPIYCMKGDDIWGTTRIQCSDCTKSKQNTVVTSNPGGIRVHSLENIANSVNYPCRNKKNGCTFISKPKMMRDHLAFCLYGIHACPLHEYINCIWRGPGKDTRLHILQNHNNLILNSSTVTENLSKSILKVEQLINSFPTMSKESNTTFTKCYVITFENSLFRVHFARVNSYYYWDVQIIGPFVNQYMYELEIVDIKNELCSLVAKQPCTALKKKDDVVKTSKCFFHQDQVKDFTAEDKVTFKVRVYDKFQQSNV